MKHLIGIDVGTSGVKTILVNELGDLLATAFEDYPLSTPHPNWAEQDPADWWRATINTTRDVVSAADVDAASICGVALSGQMHSSVMLDDQNEVLRPSMLWCDTRTTEQCRWITDTVGEDQLSRWVSNPALEGFTAPKLIWVRDHEPDVFARIRRVMLPKDYVRFRMTGKYGMEVSDAAGTLLFDVQNRCWSTDMIGALGLSEEIMPPVFESIDICGEITDSVAEVTGLRAGTPVVAGGADNTCGAVGTGIVSPGLVLASLGTSGVVFAHTDDVKVDPEMRVHSFCHSVPGKWYLMGVSLFAGGSLQWFRNNLGQLETVTGSLSGLDPYELLTREAEQAPAGSEGLVFLPYLMGERTPHKDANAKGAFVGITGRHERSHMVRAVMEGITFALRDSLEIMHGLGLEVEQIRTTGGGARSKLWRQIQADVYGAEVVTVNKEEGPAFGAAVLAGVGTGLYPGVEAACEELIKIETRTEPNSSDQARYEDQYGIFTGLYPALKPSFDSISEIVKNDTR
ncbi:MAG: xylulokinase [Candidatus Latescibacteria bacterium]|jgi:xylulokinase|nr:xylulokinase [Candidatus Latescibacterota bacterium]